VSEPVHVSRRGKSVVSLGPPVADSLSGLVRCGELRLARTRLPLLSAKEAWSEDSAGLDAILEDRDGKDSRDS
jgi:hypothetical protein